jgi:hypothetical protein
MRSGQQVAAAFEAERLRSGKTVVAWYNKDFKLKKEQYGLKMSPRNKEYTSGAKRPAVVAAADGEDRPAQAARVEAMELPPLDIDVQIEVAGDSQ